MASIAPAPTAATPSLATNLANLTAVPAVPAAAPGTTTVMVFGPNGQAVAAVPSSLANIIIPPQQPPKEKRFWVIEHFNLLTAAVGLVISGTTIAASFKKWVAPWLRAKKLASSSFLKINAPQELGPYLCSGHAQTDATVCALIDEVKRCEHNSFGDKRAPDLLVRGPRSVGKVGIAQGIAAALGWPTIHIDLGQVASLGAIPPGFVKRIEKAVNKARHKYRAAGAVVILENIEKATCSLQDPFVRALAESLLSKGSSLEKHAVVIGTLDEENLPSVAEGTKPAGHQDHITRPDLLQSIIDALGKTIEANEPQTPHQTAMLVKRKLQVELKKQAVGLDLPGESFVDVMELVRALPQLRDDALASKLAQTTVSKLAKGKGFSAAMLRETLIAEALDLVEGVRAKRHSSPESSELHARQVLCETLVAHSLGLKVLAIGVQSRNNDAYVCRERVSDCHDTGEFEHATVGGALREMTALWARYLGTKPPYTRSQTEVPLYEADVVKTISALSLRVAKSLLAEKGTVPEVAELRTAADKLQQASRGVAAKMLQALANGNNQRRFQAGIERLSAAKRQVPELCCDNLTEFLRVFETSGADQVFRAFEADPLRKDQ